MSQFDEQGSSAGQADLSKEVGYRRPPEEHRFKEGVSGNPKGRPRKKPAAAGSLSSEWNDLIKKEVNAPIKVIRNGEAQIITVFQAILQLHRNAVLKKDLKHADRLMDRALKVQQAEQKEHERQFEQRVKYKLHWAKQIHRSQFDGYEPFIPVPNPDDMVIDSRKREVIINGPADDVEKADWDRSEDDRRKTLLNVKSLEETLSGSSRELKRLRTTRKDVESMLAAEIEKLETLNAFYPPAKVRRQPGFNLERWRKDKEKGRKSPTWD